MEPLLFHGMRNLDLPFLYYRRPLWDIVLIGLSIGGLALSATTLLLSWRRLVRHARRTRGALAVLFAHPKPDLRPQQSESKIGGALRVE